MRRWVLPVLAFAEQQTFAEQRAQHPHGGRSTPVTVGILDEDMVDPLGPIENDLPAAEKAAVDYLLFEGLGRKGQEGVVAQRLGDNSPGKGAGRRSRRRKDQWLSLGHSGDPLVTKRHERDRDRCVGFQPSVAAPAGAAAPASTRRPTRRS